jgi:fermentation-respiration switch protein FrsA (DUF1100 family)
VELRLKSAVEEGILEEGMEHLPRMVELKTTAGSIHCRLHAPKFADAAIIWVFGETGGLGGPAGGMYQRLAQQLWHENIASLEVDYRNPGDMVSCVIDVLVANFYLRSKGCTKTILIGHSFGAAVVINAGIELDNILGVAALSSQTDFAGRVHELSPKPLLLMHGTEDEVLPHVGSERIYERAREPKKLLLYPCRHGLDACRDQIDSDLKEWIRQLASKTHGEKPGSSLIQ